MLVKVMNSKNLQLRLLYPAKPSVKIKGQTKSFLEKAKGVNYHQTSITKNMKGLF